MAQTIPLTGLMDAIEGAVPRGLLVSDTSGNVEIFFKYKGALVVAADQRDVTPQSFLTKIQPCLLHGGHFAISLAGGQQLDDFLHPDHLPIELLNRDNITESTLEKFRGDEDGLLLLHRDYRFIVITPNVDLPEWAQRLINDGLLHHVVIANQPQPQPKTLHLTPKSENCLKCLYILPYIMEQFFKAAIQYRQDNALGDSLYLKGKQDLYIIEKQVGFSGKVFLAKNLQNTEYMIKIIETEAYAIARNLYQTLKQMQSIEFNQSYHEILVLSEYSRWALAIIYAYEPSVTLEEWLYLNQHTKSKCPFPNEALINMFIDLLQFIGTAHNQGIILSSIVPENVYITQSGKNKLLSNQSLYVKLGFCNNLISKTRFKNLIPDQFSMQSDIWLLGTTMLFAKLGNELLQYQNLQTLGKNELGKICDRMGTGLRDIIKLILCGNTIPTSVELLEHPYVKTWNCLRRETVPQITDKCLQAINSGLSYSSHNVRDICLQSLLSIGRVNLGANVIANMIKAGHLRQNWDQEDFRTFFDLITHRQQLENSRNILVANSFLVFKPWMLQYIGEDQLISFVCHYSENNTLTCIQQLVGRGVLDRIIRGKSKSFNPSIVKTLIAFSGKDALMFMESARKSNKLSDKRHLLDILFDIPLHFKNNEAALDILQTIIKKIRNSQKEDIFGIGDKLLMNLWEILIETRRVQNHIALGRCISYEDGQALMYQGKSPVLLYCKGCQISICITCYKASHSDHPCDYLLYNVTRVNNICECNERHRIEPWPLNSFGFAPANRMYTFEAWTDSGKQSVFSDKVFTSQHGSYTTVFTQQQLNDLQQADSSCYYEVNILDAGLYEGIEIGFKDTGITYNGHSGEVRNGQTKIGIGPRLGSFDAVGLGFMPPDTIFWSYNGIPVDYVKGCSITTSLIPMIRLRGKGVQIEININPQRWKLQLPMSYLESGLAFDEELNLAAERKIREPLNFFLSSCMNVVSGSSLDKQEALRSKVLQIRQAIGWVGSQQ